VPWRNARYFRLVPDVPEPRAELVLTPAGIMPSLIRL
jgi:hypothetical protein